MLEKARLKYIVPLALTVSMGFLQVGYCLGYFNGFTMITHSQYVHADKTVIEDPDLFNSIVAGLIPLGAIFGAPLLSQLARKGRRVAVMGSNVVMIIGCAITMIFNLYALIIGRLIMGLAIGGYIAI